MKRRAELEFLKIFSNKTNFFELLIRQCKYTLDGSAALQKYFETMNDAEAERVKVLEKEADNMRKNIIEELERTFITPFEREDIYSLSRTIDDILDYFNTTVKEMETYEMVSTEKLTNMVNVLNEATSDIYNAVCLMSEGKKEAMQYALKAKKKENEVESLYRKNVAELFENDDIKYILKTREIYRHLNNCADKIVTSADIIEHILVKII